MDKGVVVRWNDDRGFGFLRTEGGSGDVFVHISAFANRSRRPAVGDRVRYSVTRTGQGKVQAKRVWFDGERTRDRRGPSPVPVILAMLFFALLAYLTITGQAPLWIIAWYGIFSGVALALYWHDKSAARASQWRVPEGWLQIAGLVGGWPGSLVAQNRLRHKSRKVEFQAVFWITVGANVAGLFWLLSPRGVTYLNRLTRYIDEILSALL